MGHYIRSLYIITEMSNVYDVEDLKAQIRQMRSTRLALQQESEALEKEINSLQVSICNIKDLAVTERLSAIHYPEQIST